MRVTLQAAADEFIQEMISRRLATTTLRTRSSYIRRFVISCDQLTAERSGNRRRITFVSDVDPSYVAKFFAALGGSQGNHNNALVAIKGFASYLERMKFIDHGGTHWLIGDRKLRPAPRTPKHYIPADEFSLILDVAEEWHETDRITLALALYTLGRQSELRAMRLKSIDLKEGVIKLYRSKFRRWTDTGISPDLGEELSWWLSWYAAETGCPSPAVMIDEHPDWYLIPGRYYIRSHGTAGRFDTNPGRFGIHPDKHAGHLEETVHRVLDRMGIPTLNEGIHTVRRSGARAMFDYLASNQGHDKALLMVSTMLDHSDPKQTLLYIGREIERDQLNDWLRGNSMYGTRTATHQRTGNVAQMPQRGPVRAAEALEPEIRVIGHG